MADGRTGNGSAPKLTARRRDAPHAALQTRPPAGGLWAGPKVVGYVADRWGVCVGPVTGWRSVYGAVGFRRAVTLET